VSDCVFCRIVRGELPAQVVARGDGFVAFRDISPKAPVHVLVVPERHVESLADVADLDEATRAAMPVFMASVARDAGLEGTGYRVTANHGPHAHQSVAHLHWHVMGGAELSMSM
jgi:histidine triad (HIT) family protein